MSSRVRGTPALRVNFGGPTHALLTPARMPHLPTVSDACMPPSLATPIPSIYANSSLPEYRCSRL